MIMFIPINYTKANFQQIMKVFYKNDFKSYLDGQKEKIFGICLTQLQKTTLKEK